MSSRNLSQKTNEQICFSILTVRKYLKLERKTNSFVRFLREVTARQFCFEIYWPLRYIIERWDLHDGGTNSTFIFGNCLFLVWKQLRFSWFYWKFCDSYNVLYQRIEIGTGIKIGDRGQTNVIVALHQHFEINQIIIFTTKSQLINFCPRI